MPLYEASKTDGLLDILVGVGAAKSKGEARRLIEGGGVSLDERKATLDDMALPAEIVEKGSFILHKGKKMHINVTLK